ncbi:MAG: hypothetical protein C0454_03300 [Parvibaculum sp.]|nr:hypothetical protein [Parvibaculum sp.]
MLAEPDVLQTDGARSFFGYWDSLPKQGFVPDRADFSPGRIAALMPAVTILEVVSDDLILQRLTGTGVCRALGFDPTGGNALDLMQPQVRPDYLNLIRQQISTPCGRWNLIRSRRENLIERAEVLTLPMRHGPTGHWMIISYFATVGSISYDPGPYEILAYENTSWIDIGAGVPRIA